ncbi:hypothetical protein BDY19DRAFT_892622 [Irpex rosettiformis]|uniref:Uncharacterized protein n=1 Tax=Irpex rosettiformis TaxID=378272 RepID=A0ACB8U082_9APHY|nr:hypothetical protein BDY19DRAFT_892622 [Irpex rosettiformis]
MYVVLGASLGASSVAGGIFLRRRYWVRIPTQDSVTPKMYKRWIKGRVTAVGDSDNFRLYHTPGFGWRWPFRFRKVPDNARGQTISIRLAGIDAPEVSHFAGQEAQKYYEESLKWLTNKIKGKTVYCKLMQKDQYGRIIALVYSRARWFPGTKNISMEMLREGWAHVYEQSGGVYGDAKKEDYLAIQEQAKSKRRGIWKNPREEQEHPSEYKRRYAAATGIPEAAVSAAPNTSASGKKK